MWRHIPLLARCAIVAAFSATAGFAEANDLPVRGIVRAVNQAALSTDIPMRIARLPFREGEQFKATDLLVEFDCRRQNAACGDAG